jgi:hypothetical protein
MNLNQPNIKDTLSFINDTYDKLSYFDLYGNSVFLFIFITLFVFSVFSYCQVMQTKQAIADDWVNQRCKPQNMLFAGLITHPEDISAFQYTSDNFQFCVQNILTNISGYALKPFLFMIQSLTQIFQEMANSIQESRELINKIRNGFKQFSQDVFERLLNIMTPIQKTIVTLMDTFQKIQGVMTAGLYTMLGTYYTLQALMASILDFIVKILVALVIVIMGLWVMPFTWPVAATTTSIFAAIAIPLTIIIYFMSEVLHIKSNSIPKLRCFDENTIIPLHDGNTIAIQDIQVGDILANGGYVTAKIKVTSTHMKMYNLHNIIISESHLVKYKEDWIRVGEHPDALQIDYNKSFLYCLNTSNKVIKLNNLVFSDWDELINSTYQNLEKIDDIGFEEHTAIKLYDHAYSKPIKYINIGDILENKTMVYGLVEIYRPKLRNHNKILYHLLTTDGSLIINAVDVKDYNNIIDKFII